MRPLNKLLPGTLIATLIAATAWSQAPQPSLFSGMRWRMIGPFRGGRVLPALGIPGNATTTKEEGINFKNTKITTGCCVAAIALIDAGLHAQTQAPSHPGPFFYEGTVYFSGFGTNPPRSIKTMRARNSAGIGVRGDGYDVKNEQVKSEWKFRKIYHPDGLVQSTHESVRSVTSIFYGSPQVQTKVPNDLKACIGTDEKLVGDLILAGVRVSKISSDSSRAVSTRTIWVEGGCVELESVHQWREITGKLGGITTVKLDVLKLEEPPADLFTVTSDYIEESQTEASLRDIGYDLSKATSDFHETLASQGEMKMYRNLGPGPGGRAEAIARQHNLKAPDPSSRAMKISLEEARSGK